MAFHRLRIHSSAILAALVDVNPTTDHSLGHLINSRHPYMPKTIKPTKSPITIPPSCRRRSIDRICRLVVPP